MSLMMNPFISFPTSAAFSPEAVEFDGTNDYLTHTGSFTGAADNKFITVSAWFWLDSLAIQRTILATAANGHIQVRVNASGKPDLHAHSTPGFEGCIAMESSNILTVGTQYHILYSADCADVAKCFGYVNEAALTFSAKLITDANIKWTGGQDHLIGTMFNFGSLMDGSLGEVYMTNEWLDISLLANRRKFINADGTPADLGSDGSTPTGTQPLLYMKGEAADWNAGTANAGSGGTMTMTGAVVDSAHEPMDISP